MIEKLTQNYLLGLKKNIDSLPLGKIDEVIDLMLKAYDGNRQIFIFGNGGSASTASHFACDINKGVSLGLEKRFKVICLNDNLPIMLAYGNDISYEDIFIEQLKNFLGPNDIVVGFSGSGNSKNVIKAIQYANENNADSIAFTGLDGGELVKIAKTSIVVPTDNMQRTEDLHLVLTHIIMQVISEKLRKNGQ